MQLTARLKNIDELKKLESYMGINSYGLLEFKYNTITSDMLKLGLVDLSWNKSGRRFVDDNFSYCLDWLTDITVSDDKLKLGLEIDGLTLTVRILDMDESLRNDNGGECAKIYKQHKNKFHILSELYLEIKSDSLYLHGVEDEDCTSYTFQSQKLLTKWIRNLIKCK